MNVCAVDSTAMEGVWVEGCVLFTALRGCVCVCRGVCALYSNRGVCVLFVCTFSHLVYVEVWVCCECVCFKVGWLGVEMEGCMDVLRHGNSITMRLERRSVIGWAESHG